MHAETNVPTVTFVIAITLSCLTLFFFASFTIVDSEMPNKSGGKKKKNRKSKLKKNGMSPPSDATSAEGQCTSSTEGLANTLDRETLVSKEDSTGELVFCSGLYKQSLKSLNCHYFDNVANCNN